MATNGKSKKSITPRQKKAIIALISSSSVTQAAEMAKVGTRTIHRWLSSDEKFLHELHNAQTEAIDQAVRRLVGELDTNIETMKSIRDDLSIHPSVRLRAARSLEIALLRWWEV
jgi:hypothetical protein